MTHKEFNEFLEWDVIEAINDVLSQKSSDYSHGDDKTFNFKLAGRIDDISAIEALRGMQLKHRASICQGLDELKNNGKCRDFFWWREKIIDDINYNILLLAMIKFKELS